MEQLRRPLTLVQSSLFGIGISPPAVNFADSPEIAVSVGSARTRDTPARSNACRVADAEKPPLEIPAVIRLPGLAPGLTGEGLMFWKLFPPMRFCGLNADQLPDVLMPNCFNTVRPTSTTVTCSITWSLPRIERALMTAPLVATPAPAEMPTNAFAMSTTCWASAADATLPVSRTESP